MTMVILSLTPIFGVIAASVVHAEPINIIEAVATGIIIIEIISWLVSQDQYPIKQVLLKAFFFLLDRCYVIVSLCNFFELFYFL
jgi:hypothetical protein